MAKHRARRHTRRALSLWLSLLLLVVAGGGVVALHVTGETTTTTTTTTVPPEMPEAGWRVASTSARGVLVDFKTLTLGTTSFRVLRMRARTTLLHWHVGNSDPTNWKAAPTDAGPAITANEFAAGVVAVFNGGFKQAAKAGGEVVDGVTLNPLVAGDSTVVIDAAGHWEMGVWGAKGFPTKGFNPVAYRQNLAPLVSGGVVVASAQKELWGQWGDPLHESPLTPRTALGVDANGNLIYVASMGGVMPGVLGEALVDAGAVSGMELDMNPYWPIAGAGGVAHSPAQLASQFVVTVPGQEHAPSIFSSGWERDFFVVMAEPSKWSCSWQSAGLKASVTGAQPQPLTLQGKRCAAVPTQASTVTSATTATPATTPVAGATTSAAG